MSTCGAILRHNKERRQYGSQACYIKAKQHRQISFNSSLLNSWVALRVAVLPRLFLNKTFQISDSHRGLILVSELPQVTLIFKVQ
jgi:hypothetical protein